VTQILKKVIVSMVPYCAQFRAFVFDLKEKSIETGLIPIEILT
jgi:hypothetical protein